MWGPPLIVEGLGLGLLASWEVASTGNPVSLRWREFWQLSGSDSGGVGAVPGFQPSQNHVAKEDEIWWRAAHEVLRLLEQVIDEASNYYNDNAQRAPSPERDAAKQQIGSLIAEITAESYRTRSLVGWKPEVIDGFYYAMRLAQEWLLTDSRGSVVRAVYQAALAFKEPGDSSLSAVACRRIGLELPHQPIGRDGRPVKWDSVTGGLHRVALALMGTKYAT